MTPKVRFKEFDDAWEQRKLKEIACKVKNKNKENAISETFTNSAEFGIISQKEFFDHEVASKTNLDSYYIVDIDDFVYNPRISVTAPVGPINRNKLGKAGVMSPLYTVFKTQGVSIDFLEHYFKSTNWHSYMYLNGDSGARSDRFSIKDDVFFDMPIMVPCIKEQMQIGLLFNAISKNITLHQRQCEVLKKQKQFFLQNMFPKEGESEPRIRFNGFTEPWEQRELREFVDKAVDNRGKTPSLNKDGNHPLIEVASLGNCRPDYSKVSKYLDDNAFYNELRSHVKEDDILFSTVGNVGLVSLMDKRLDACIAQNIVAFRAKNYIDAKFLFALFSNDENQKKAKRIVMGAVQPSIKVSQLVEVKYFLPILEEQQKIGSYFEHLDNLITLHQRQYEQLVSLKKYLLSKMFI